MPALPNWQFQNPLGAFAKCGLDFAGPFESKAAGFLVLANIFSCLFINEVHTLKLLESLFALATRLHWHFIYSWTIINKTT